MWSIVQAAGWPIWPLIFASVIALALIFERLWSLRQSVVAPPGLVDRVLVEYRQNGATPELIARVAQQGPLGRILATGLANVKSPRAVIKEAIEEVGRVVTHDLERFLTTLGTIAAMAPLLGLFGTVVGMIEIFGSQTAGGIQSLAARARDFRRAVQHRVRPDRRDPQHDLLPPFPRDDRQPGRGDGAAGDQARRLRARRTPMNLRGTRPRDDPEINFIPLIDVLLVILIFLMVTTTYQRVAELQITLPEADAEQPKQRPEGESTSASMPRDATSSTRTVFTYTTTAALADALKAAAGDTKEPVVIISADATATHQSVIHVMEACADRGLRACHVRDPGAASQVTV